MNSDFLNKFKGKTSKVPKEGVVNLIEATHKKPSKQIQLKPSEVKQSSSEKQAKKKQNNQKISPYHKQNARVQNVSQNENKVKRAKQKSNIKTREILSVKQNKKPLEININVKKQPLKLPKISKENTINYVQSVRENAKQQSKQNKNKNNLQQQTIQKQKKNLLTESRNVKQQKPKAANHGIESILDEEALIQLKKLNDFEIIVHEMQIRRKYEMQEEELLQKSRNLRKGATVHYS